MPALGVLSATGMQGNRVLNIGESAITVAPILAIGKAFTLQQIRAVFQPGKAGHLGRQDGGLVVTALEQPAPMQGHGRDQHARSQDRFRRPHEPCPRRTDQIKPIPML